MLGFFFSDLPEGEVVLVTRGGLELNSFVAGRRGLRLRHSVRLPVTWYTYSQETRMLLVGTGSLAG